MLRVPCLLSALALAGALAGCAADEPPPPPPPQPVPSYVPQSMYDRAWNAALSAVQDAGVQLKSVDRPTGVIRGSKDGIDVTVSVVRQADGSVRVQFNSPGDPALAQRFSQAYDRRMGR